MGILLLFNILVLSLGSYVNRKTLNLNQLSSLIPLTNGNFIGFHIAQPKDENASFSYQCQVFDSLGNQIKPTVTLISNFTDIADQVNSRLSIDTSIFLKVWSSQPSLNEYLKYFGVIFNLEGLNVTAPFEIASQCGHESRSSRAYYTNLGNDSFVFVWTSLCDQRSQLMAQIIGLDGSKIGPPIVIIGSTETDFDVCFSDLTPLSGGGFVVLYEARFSLSSDSIGYAQKYNDKGEKQDSPVEVIKTTTTSITCALGPYNGRGNILGVVGLNNNHFVVFSMLDGLLKVSAWDSQTMKQTNNYSLDKAPKEWSYDSLFYAPLEDQSIVKTGCCTNTDSYVDLWVFRVKETGLVEMSELDLLMAQPFFYFSAFENNTVVLLHMLENSETGYDEVGLLLDFVDEVENHSFLTLGDDDKILMMVGIAVIVGAVLILVLGICFVKIWKTKNVIKNPHQFVETLPSNEIIYTVGSEMNLEEK